MERDQAIIGAAELEVLKDFLGVPSHKIWQLTSHVGKTDPLLIPFTPGQPTQVVFDARKQLG